jgi:outer membrane receptor protein involved in Fe transport
MVGRRRHQLSTSTALATVIAGSATVFLAAVEAPRASAQEGGALASKIEEVVVSARRRDESLLRVPATIQALTGKELAAQSINTEADLQRAVPGLVIRESLSSNQLNYSIRGQSVDAFSSSSPGVLSYFNEFQATATSASGLYDLQSIQVVKGPQGTLYGRNTTGGAVLYTTARPTEEFAAGLNVKLGDYAMRSAEGFVSTPLAGDKAQLRIAGQPGDQRLQQAVEAPETERDVWARSGHRHLGARLYDRLPDATVGEPHADEPCERVIPHGAHRASGGGSSGSASREASKTLPAERWPQRK